YNVHELYTHYQQYLTYFLLEMVNQSLRNRDKLKDDAIAHLSDQLMALSTRLQEIERRQQLV
ncbi:MAG: hypothetical protein WAK17_24185, partial [Candidatus Nitrosopolaris sp.]